MGDRLFVEARGGVYRLRWFIEDDQEEAHALGEVMSILSEPEPKERGVWEDWKAHQIVSEMKPARDRYGYFWDTKKDAEAVLRLVREALKQDRPLPEWAKTALAHGWKPPKGWKA